MKDAGTQTHTRGEDSHGEPRRDLDETVRLGLEIYERDIRHKVEKDHVGKIVAIDVDTGSWALGDDSCYAGRGCSGGAASGAEAGSH